MTTASDADVARAWGERAARALALAALVLAGWQAVRDGRAQTDVATMASVRPLRLEPTAGLADSLRAAVVAQGGQDRRDTLLLTVPVVPPAAVRAALSVLLAAGIPVRWTDSTAARGLALSAARASGPRGGYVVRASGGLASSALVLRDGGSLLDSLPADARADHAGTTWRVSSLAPPLEARVAGGTATVALPDTSAPRRLLVIAQPGWESKFAVAALEETGWRVDGALRISPTGVVQLGQPQRPDTARYAAVLVLDSVAVDAAALTRFVTLGGGLVLAGDALRIPTLASLRPARATELRGGVAGALLTEAPRRGLEAWELEVAADATVLQADVGDDSGDHAHAEPAVVVRRVGAGRVVATSYRETWRWRMQGTDDGAADHRSWWAGIIGAVSPDVARPARAVATVGPGDAAPYADLVARIGAPSPPSGQRPAVTPRAPRGPSPALLFVVTALALLAEWTSRRLRGLR